MDFIHFINRNQRIVIFTAFIILGTLVTSGTAQAEGWEEVDSGVTNDLYDVFFPTPCTGYAVGGGALPSVGGAGVLLKSSDSGISWESQTIPAIPVDPAIPEGQPFLRGIDCVNESLCYAAGSNGVILKTTDGSNWSGQVLEGDDTRYRPFFEDMKIVDSFGDVAVAVAAPGIIYRTTNGTDWVQLTSPSIPDDLDASLTKVFFVNETTGWIIGLGSTILKTTDGGATWDYQELAADEGGLLDVFALSETTAWTSGGIDAEGVAVHKTEDGGLAWSPQGEMDVTVTYYGIFFLNEEVGFTVGSSGIMRKSFDGGATWAAADRDTESGTGATLRGIDCPTDELCFVVGDDGTILRRPPVTEPECFPDLTLLPWGSLACGSSEFHTIITAFNAGTTAAGSFSTKIESIGSDGNTIGTAVVHRSDGLAPEGMLVIDNRVASATFNPDGNPSVTLRMTVDFEDEIFELNEDNNVQIMTTPCARAVRKWTKRKKDFFPKKK